MQISFAWYSIIFRAPIIPLVSLPLQYFLHMFDKHRD